VNYKIFPENTSIRIDGVLNYFPRYYIAKSPVGRKNSAERITSKALLY